MGTNGLTLFFLALCVGQISGQQQPGQIDLVSTLPSNIDSAEGVTQPDQLQSNNDTLTLLANNGGMFGSEVDQLQQIGLANLLALLGNTGNGSGLLQTALQQPGLTSLLTTLLSNNEASLALLQTPEIVANFAKLFDYLNTTGNITGVVTALSTDPQVSVLSSTLLTVLFESLSLTVFTNNRVSDACQTDLIIFIEELVRGNAWALKMLDATGKPGSDLSDGLTKFVGSYEECVGIHAVSYTTRDLDDVTGDVQERTSFDGKYCSITARLPGAPEAYLKRGAGYLQLGLCVPHTCSHTDVEILATIVEKALFSNSVPIVPTVRCQEGRKDIGTDVIVVTGILAIIGCLVIIGTIYDIIGQNKQQNVETNNTSDKADYGEKSMMDKRTGMEENRLRDESTSTRKVETREDTSFTRNTKRKRPIEKFVLAFSVHTNGKKLLRVNHGGELDAINGIRFLTQAWIILGHTNYYVQRYDANLLQKVFETVKDVAFTPVSYGEVSVDTFFVLSGVMVSYFTLKQLRKVGGPRNINWFMFYFHRYWRLTPLYMLIIMFATVILPYTLYGPFWDYDNFPETEACRTLWWTNLLYINIFVGVQTRCLGWTWYLSNDMQFYWISPLLLIPFFYNMAAGLVLSILLIIVGFVIIGVTAHEHRYPAQQYAVPFIPLEEQATDDFLHENLYKPSYARAGPFIVGVIAGYLLYRCKCKLRIPKLFNIAGWILCLSLTSVIIYGLYSNEDDHVFSQIESDLYLALHKTAWGVAVAWVIVACVTGNGGIINTWLSWKVFTPLSRLTYSVYLIHPLVMMTFYSSRMVTTYMTYYELIYLFLGHLTLSYSLAFVVSLVFESPWMALEKAFLHGS